MIDVGIIDSGLGNFRSVAGAVSKVGYTSVISDDPDILRRANRLILPGVGAFGDGMRNLQARNLVGVLQELVIDQGKPILGICLGLQLFAREGEEFGRTKGLGWIDASVKRLDPDGGLRVPHVGWNDLTHVREWVLYADIPEDALFYYTHSFFISVDEPAVVTGTCDYGGKFVASFQKGNIYATQFHPEKSQRHGLQLLENFLSRT